MRTDTIWCCNLQIDITSILLIKWKLCIVMFDKPRVFQDRKIGRQSDLKNLPGYQLYMVFGKILVATNDVRLFDAKVVSCDKERSTFFRIVSR